MQGGFMQKTADFVFSFAIPVHSHICMNAIVTDYLPSKFRGESHLSSLCFAAVDGQGACREIQGRAQRLPPPPPPL